MTYTDFMHLLDIAEHILMGDFIFTFIGILGMLCGLVFYGLLFWLKARWLRVILALLIGLGLSIVLHHTLEAWRLWYVTPLAPPLNLH